MPTATVREVLFPETERRRLAVCLRRLLPHVARERVALTGGLAIGIHLAAAGRTDRREAIADVDLVAAGVDAIAPTIAGDLLISHYHLPQPGDPKFMIQLVDPVSALRIDVFPDLVGSIATAAQRVVAGHQLAVLDAESILAHKRLTLSKATSERPVDEKHQRDALVLAEICGREGDRLPPECLTREIYGKDPGACPRCDSSRTPEFPLAPKQRIFDILGYT